MLKSGLIVGGVVLVLGVIAGATLTPLCIPCLAVLGGLGSGYLAGQFDRPGAANAAARVGAGAGAIGGGGGLLGHLIAGGINAVLVGPQGASDILSQLGIPSSSNPTYYYAGAVGGAFCLGLFEVVLMAALGAVGGLLWFQITGKNASPPAPAM